MADLAVILGLTITDLPTNVLYDRVVGVYVRNVVELVRDVMGQKSSICSDYALTSMKANLAGLEQIQCAVERIIDVRARRQEASSLNSQRLQERLRVKISEGASEKEERKWTKLVLELETCRKAGERAYQRIDRRCRQFAIGVQRIVGGVRDMIQAVERNHFPYAISYKK